MKGAKVETAKYMGLVQSNGEFAKGQQNGEQT